MGKLVVIAAFSVTCAALLLGGEAKSGSPASRPASRPARPAVPIRRLKQLIGQLASEQYGLRRSARKELTRAVELPGVAEVLRAYLTTAEDTEVRTFLKGVLGGYDQPLVMLWYRGGNKDFPYVAPAAWLFIEADGRFVYDARSFLFTPKPRLPGLYRQGRLPGERLLALKEKVAASGLARGPSGGAVSGRSADELLMSFYLRSGQLRRTFITRFHVGRIRPGKKPPAGMTREEKLAASLRDVVAACPHAPYEGPMAVHTIYNPPAIRGKPRQHIQKLPDWPVAGVNIRHTAARQEGIRVDGKQLQRVRAALAKTSLYKYSRYGALQVLLAPYVEDAVRLYYGPAR